jgi:hypothetical protein
MREMGLQELMGDPAVEPLFAVRHELWRLPAGERSRLGINKKVLFLDSDGELVASSEAASGSP